MKTSELVASILVTNPDYCNFNRSVVLMVRDHPIDMRDDHAGTVLNCVAQDDDIRLELEALHSFLDEAMRSTAKQEEAA